MSTTYKAGCTRGWVWETPLELHEYAVKRMHGEVLNGWRPVSNVDLLD